MRNQINFSNYITPIDQLMVFEVYGTTFNVDPRYTFCKALGKGAYGVVCSAKDSVNNRKVAIKKICPMAKSVYDAKHTLREIRLLRHCGQHPNVITLLDLMVDEANDELYIGMECMDTDLHRIIQSSQKLSISHHKHFMYQLILGIDFLHSHGILHRDLKPANLLVSKNCDLRISDFGLARRAANETDAKPLMTEHVVTRWYRPPELMLSPDGKYTAAVDIWSIGCIFAELLGRTPLFPGKNFVHQLQLIFDVIGTPAPCETSYIKNSQAIQFLRSLPNKRAVDLASIYPHAGDDAIHFMEECIKFKAGSRITVKEALEHPFFANAPLKDKPLVAPEMDLGLFCFEFEQHDLDEKALRRIIIQEVDSFNRMHNIRPLGRKQKHSNQEEIPDQVTQKKKKSSGGRAMSARYPSNSSVHKVSRPQSAVDYHRSSSENAMDISNNERERERSENDQLGNHSEPGLKKKKKSFTSRLLSTGRSSKLPVLPHIQRSSSSGTSNSRASPMSCSSPESYMSVDEHKHEPASSMLPIKNILRRSSRTDSKPSKDALLPSSSGLGPLKPPRTSSRTTLNPIDKSLRRPFL